MWLAYAIAAAILWGLNYSLSERILQFISPLTLLALEMLVGACLFFSLAWSSHLRTDLTALTTNKSLAWLTVVGVITVLAANFLILLSIREKNATVAGMIELAYPLFIIFFTWFLFRENHVNISVAVGGLFIVTGVIIMSFA